MELVVKKVGSNFHRVVMRLLGNFVVMYDSHTTFFKWKVNNRYLAIIFCCYQMFVSSISLAQHVYSVLQYRKIFNCQFNASFRHDFGKFLAYDIVIYDFGLFNFLLGTDECVANYLDGGYMRCLWCISQVSSMIIFMVILLAQIRRSLLLCPILLQQSVYSLGLIILTIATIPKLLNAFVSKLSARFIQLISIFASGMIMTWLFTFTVWHYYWYLDRMENEQKARFKQLRNVYPTLKDYKVCHDDDNEKQQHDSPEEGDLENEQNIIQTLD